MRPVERRRRRRLNARANTKVLIVDDSATIVAALKKTLHSAGYATFQAFDAETALDIARQEQPELIFLDIVLPGMNGFAALRQMRRDEMTRHIPVIMISGNEQATEQFYANRIGADDFMKKPFSRLEVFAKIEPLLDADMIPRRKHAADAPTGVAGPARSRGISARPGSADTIEAAFREEDQRAVFASTAYSPLDARKALTEMGLQYFDPAQFVAAIQRGDKLACELFVAGGGVDIGAEFEGKTPLQTAREHGRTQIFALLRAQLAAPRPGVAAIAPSAPEVQE